MVSCHCAVLPCMLSVCAAQAAPGSALLSLGLVLCGAVCVRCPSYWTGRQSWPVVAEVGMLAPFGHGDMAGAASVAGAVTRAAAAAALPLHKLPDRTGEVAIAKCARRAVIVTRTF